ncbi:MAG: hypothetical protein ACLQVD_00725 [Capsulimonadaceae bacterium]
MMLSRRVKLAITGLAIFVVLLAVACLGWKTYVELYAQRLTETDEGICESYGHLLWEYAIDHDNKLPDAHHWEDALRPYWHTKWGKFSSVLPVFPWLTQKHRLAMNIRCSGRDQDDISTTDTVLYETISDHPNTFGVPSMLPNLVEIHRPQVWYCGGGGWELTNVTGCGEPFYEGPMVSKFDKK